MLIWHDKERTGWRLRFGEATAPTPRATNQRQLAISLRPIRSQGRGRVGSALERAGKRDSSLVPRQQSALYAGAASSTEALGVCSMNRRSPPGFGAMEEGFAANQAGRHCTERTDNLYEHGAAQEAAVCDLPPAPHNQPIREAGSAATTL